MASLYIISFIVLYVDQNPLYLKSAESMKDAIRHGYWAAVDGITPSHHAEPGHIRHCIDYLRQSIICHADTNLEPIDENLGGVTGFGFSRKCRDIVRLMKWAEDWRTHNQTDHT